MLNLEKEDELRNIPPWVLGTIMTELTKLFTDINHYSRVEKLIGVGKRFYENFGVMEYAIAYVWLMLCECEDFILLNESVDQYLEKVMAVVEKAGIDLEDQWIKRSLFTFKISSYLGNNCSKSEENLNKFEEFLDEHKNVINLHAFSSSALEFTTWKMKVIDAKYPLIVSIFESLIPD